MYFYNTRDRSVLIPVPNLNNFFKILIPTRKLVEFQEKRTFPSLGITIGNR